MNMNGNVVFAFTAEDELLDKVERIEEGYGLETKAIMQVIAAVANRNDPHRECSADFRTYSVEIERKECGGKTIIFVDLYCEHKFNHTSKHLFEKNAIVGPAVPKKTVLVARSYVSANRLKKNCFIWLRDRDFGRLLMQCRDQVNELIAPERKVTICFDDLKRSFCSGGLSADIALLLRDFAKHYWGDLSDPKYINVLYDNEKYLFTKLPFETCSYGQYRIAEKEMVLKKQNGLDVVEVNRCSQERFLASTERVNGKDILVIRGCFADEAKLARFEGEDFLAVAVNHDNFYNSRPESFLNATTLAELLEKTFPWSHNFKAKSQ